MVKKSRSFLKCTDNCSLFWDFGLWIVDCGLSDIVSRSIPKSQIRIPKSYTKPLDFWIFIRELFFANLLKPKLDYANTYIYNERFARCGHFSDD
jgi:hypothetical protein